MCPRVLVLAMGFLGLNACAWAQYVQQAKLTATGASGGPSLGSSVSISADGNTIVAGGPGDGIQPTSGIGPVSGATWAFVRSGSAWAQLGNKFHGPETSPSSQGSSVAVSGDGNTAVVGGPSDDTTPGTIGSVGAAWIFQRISGQFVQTAKFVPPSGNISENAGFSVGIDGNGKRAIVGAPSDNFQLGGSWIITPSSTQSFTWDVEGGGELLADDSLGNAVQQGTAVAISADGNTAIVGGNQDNNGFGAAWIYVRGSGGSWNQQGAKLVARESSAVFQGNAVAISGDGNTAVVGDFADGGAGPEVGATYVYTRSQGAWSEQARLVGAGFVGTALQGSSVAISQDGKTIVVGGSNDANGAGAIWIFRFANGAWSQVGNKLVGTGAVGTMASQGSSVAVSADGSTVVSGGPFDNQAGGAVWVFGPPPPNATRLSVTAPPSATAGSPVNITVTALDANNNTFGSYSGTVHFTSSDKAAALPADATLKSGAGMFAVTFNTAGSQTVTATDTAVSTITGTSGAVTVTGPAGGVPTAGGDSVGAGSGLSTTMTFTFNDTAGYQNLHVVDILINPVLDGRHACYIAYVPSGANSGALDLVDDGGDAGGPYSFTILPGSGTVSNSQCTVSGSASGAGNTLNLTLNITFSASFTGNKVFYLSAGDQSGANSNWQALATWNVPGSPAAGPSVTGVAPARTNSLGPTTYTFTFADTAGFQDANSIENIIINSAIDGRHACFLAFQPSSSSLFLVDDAGDAAGPYQGLTLPSSASIGNSQCTINGGSSVARNGNTLTLTLSLSFTQGFAGNQIIFMAARNSTANSGWQAAGSVTVP